MVLVPIVKTAPLPGSVTDPATQRSIRALEKTINELTARVNSLKMQTGVAVDIAAVHAALVALGLITESD